MQKPFEHTLSPESRAAISTSFLAAIAYCAAIAMACVLLSFVSPREKDAGMQATRGASPDLASGHPL